MSDVKDSSKSLFLIVNCKFITVLTGECVKKPDCRCTVQVTLADGSVVLEEKQPGEIWQDDCNQWCVICLSASLMRSKLKNL